MPVPTPVIGATTPVVNAGLVAFAGLAATSGAVGAYIASSKLVAVGLVRPAANIVTTSPLSADFVAR